MSDFNNRHKRIDVLVALYKTTATGFLGFIEALDSFPKFEAEHAEDTSLQDSFIEGVFLRTAKTNNSPHHFQLT